MDQIRLIEVKEDVMQDNVKLADSVRARMKSEKTFLLNLMSSPGAGKTTLLVKTIEMMKQKYRMAVIEADIDSIVDAETIQSKGVTAVQLRTGGFCHLDATMTLQGVDALSLKDLDLVIIENVGNLVCPAEFDTGAVKNAMILSVPEGDDKPLKYPLMFSICDILIISKIDYLSISDFNVQAVHERVKRLNPDIRIVEVCAKTGQGMEGWTEWLAGQVDAFIK
ncbi:MAG: hydrogenase accessory protein HypB [Spirochaetae bacterium HGW-Spirochaetae-1]|jgi:hydrogenase nickel incorporation protein HypB|nr:MAG: hydrogenase accessory protein HypB [Spirochaetae bacterium HGW-Spirochaetae-1]